MAFGMVTKIIVCYLGAVIFVSVSFGKMVRATWITLVLLFLVYTISIYLYGTKRKQIPPDAKAMAGWKIWQDKNCQSCHQLYGLGGYMGPDLTNVHSAKGPDYMRVFIQFGSGRMPNYHINEQDASDIIAFLAWVDKSGHAAIPSKYVHWSGSYIIEE